MSIKVCLSIDVLATIPGVNCVVTVTVKAQTSAGSNSATFGIIYILTNFIHVCMCVCVCVCVCVCACVRGYMLCNAIYMYV